MFKPRAPRRQRGNMLILVSVTMTLIAMGLTVGLSFGGVILAQTILQSYANEMALSAACRLNGADETEQAQGINSNDREGQMNNMIVRCRSMVYESKLNNDQTVTDNFPQLQGLADQLYLEAKQSARDLELERRNLKNVSEQEATNEINNQMQSRSQFKLTLPWIQCSSVRLATTNGITFGQVKDVQSNVTRLDDSNNLRSEDDTYKYVRQQSNRYNANINAKLASDPDLDFKLSSLQPPVNGEIAPARLILPPSFVRASQVSTPQGDLNSAVRVKLVMNLETKIGAATNNQITVCGFATTTGGGLMR